MLLSKFKGNINKELTKKLGDGYLVEDVLDDIYIGRKYYKIIQHPGTEKKLVYHREGGPAVNYKIRKDITAPKYNQIDAAVVIWAINGIIHREHGPAEVRVRNINAGFNNNLTTIYVPTIFKTTTIQWYDNGKPHRENGPSKIVIQDGSIIRREWSLLGVKLSEDEHKFLMTKSLFNMF